MRRGRGCVEQQQHRKRVKALRANWNQMFEATDWGILAVEQERQRGKFTSPSLPRYLLCLVSEAFLL